MAPLRRSSPAMYDPIPPTDLETAGSDSYHHGGYKPGIVGPVYTFVKTDPVSQPFIMSFWAGHLLRSQGGDRGVKYYPILANKQGSVNKGGGAGSMRTWPLVLMEQTESKPMKPRE